MRDSFERTSGNEPPIAVVIPTYNRSATLLECLHHLEAQDFDDFAVFVVDDGSTDNTRAVIAAYQRDAPFPLHYLHQSNAGQAAARNLAIASVGSPVSILIGDDIFPTPGFVRAHLEHHRAHPQLESVALGRTRWSERGQTVTPFMRWLEEDGMQFAYADLRRGVTPSWKHFYTSNLSFKTGYLQQNIFDEGFQRYGMEDIELGYRLAQRHGLRMAYLPHAEAEHLHPTDFARCCRRHIEVGAASFRLCQLWPEFRGEGLPNWFTRRLGAVLTDERIVLPLLRNATDRLTRLWCPNPLMRPVLRLHHKLGFDRAARNADI